MANMIPDGFRSVAVHVLLGIVLGVVVLHPLTRLVYWLEIRDDLASGPQNLQDFLLQHFQQALSSDQWQASLVFAIIGGGIGLIFAYSHVKLLQQSRAIQAMENVLGMDTPSLIRAGESETLEFKSSLRWDIQSERINKALEAVIIKSIAGFMNHRGGTLLIGVSDDGSIAGIERDYRTLKHKNRDGFERLIVDLVSASLGRSFATCVHCSFQSIDDRDICRVSIEASGIPVYVQDAGVSHYFVRTGNGTRELDAREAYSHILQR